jgi:peptidoglycan hydrolase CwlO-like protein
LQEKVRLFSEIQDKDIEMGTNKTKIEKLNKTIGDLDTKLTKHDKEFESMKQELKEAYINLS